MPTNYYDMWNLKQILRILQIRWVTESNWKMLFFQRQWDIMIVRLNELELQYHGCKFNIYYEILYIKLLEMAVKSNSKLYLTALFAIILCYLHVIYLFFYQFSPCSFPLNILCFSFFFFFPDKLLFVRAMYTISSIIILLAGPMNISLK